MELDSQLQTYFGDERRDASKVNGAEASGTKESKEELDKRLERAKRFGAAAGAKGEEVATSAADADADSEEAAKKAERAKRFGMGTVETSEEEAKKSERAKRFAAAAAPKEASDAKAEESAKPEAAASKPEGETAKVTTGDGEKPQSA